jgi:hypothetical protein
LLKEFQVNNGNKVVNDDNRSSILEIEKQEENKIINIPKIRSPKIPMLPPPVSFTIFVGFRDRDGIVETIFIDFFFN